MFDSRFIDPLLTPQRSRLTLLQFFHNALYHPGLLGALRTESEEIIHEGRIYQA